MRRGYQVNSKSDVREGFAGWSVPRGLVSVGYRDYWSVCSIVGASQHGWPYSRCALPGALVPSCTKRATGQYLQTFGTRRGSSPRKTQPATARCGRLRVAHDTDFRKKRVHIVTKNICFSCFFIFLFFSCVESIKVF